MNMKLNQKLIIDRCGSVSFKRGEAFYRTDKILFKQFNTDRCYAVVTGSEDFLVTVKKNEKGQLLTSCSCPKLASFDRDCQHVAAVLVALYEFQRKGTIPVVLDDESNNQDLTKEIMTLFNQKMIRTSGHQHYFENRKVLQAEFIFRAVNKGFEHSIFAVEVRIENNQVGHIREFLEQVRKGKSFLLANTFSYDPHTSCFSKETDAVIQQLIQIVMDEKVYKDRWPGMESKSLLSIPPTFWERLIRILPETPLVKIEYNDLYFDGFTITEKRLPLQFNFTEADGKDYQLSMKDLNQLAVLEPYNAVLYQGIIYQLEFQDCKRLSELKQMIASSKMNHISILGDQIGYFLDQVVSGLKRLGNVTISPNITERFIKTPLVAKLYLDRIKSRLLASLEFHYENIIINPLQNKEQLEDGMLIRDSGKEEEILRHMEESSFAKTDEGYFLHNEELEYEFLYHVLPEMRKLVQIYATTAVRNRIVKGNFVPKVRVKVKKERTNWLEFKFEMNGISENQIRELLSALEEKRKYYRLHNGSLLSLETKEWQEIKDFLYSPQIHNRDLLNGLDLPIEQCLELLDTVEVSDVFKLEESFREFLDDLLKPGKMNFVIPQGLELILRDYQKIGFQWMKTLASYGFGGILADDMGLGKTLQCITFMLSEQSNIRLKKLPVLVVCPSSLTYNWLNELTKFAPNLQAVVFDGSKKERCGLQNEVNNIDVIITSYTLLRKDIKWYENQSFFTIFFDEAQAFKNPVTQTARAVKRLRAEHRFALTGTPVENSLEELWSIFHVVFPELFRGLKEYSKLSKKKITWRIRPFLLRRLKEDVLSELPGKFSYSEAAELLPEQKQLYAAYLAKLRHDTLKHLDKDTIRKNRIKILAGLTRLRQICCHPGLFINGYKGSSAKLEQLIGMIEESKLSGRRLLIFSQFTKMLEVIGKELTLRELPFFYLDGATPAKERVKISDRFNNGERNYFLISLKAGGTGLNLTGADTVILYDTWWNPAVEEQAADRAYRMGQKNAVQVIKLVASGTIEEKINELQDKKRDLINEVIDSEEKASAMLTEEDIREILMLP